MLSTKFEGATRVMHQASMNSLKSKKRYGFAAPDEAWGYVVALSVALIFITGALPLIMFGVVFGQFLANFTAEISVTAFINTVNNTAIFFAGLPATYLLQKYTYRAVALLGAFSYFIGAFLSAFTTGAFYLIFTFGILQGFGFGLLLSSGLTAFNEYFDKRRNMMLSICHTLVGSAGMFFPAFTSCLVQEYGFRGAAIVLAALSLHLTYAAFSFQPVKWHYKKVILKEWEATEMVTLMKNKESGVSDCQINTETVEVVGHRVPVESDNFMGKEPGNSNSTETADVAFNEDDKEEDTLWKSIAKNLDLSLFKNSDYVSLSCGTSLTRASEVISQALLPALLVAHGFQEADITRILTAFFSADLAGRIFLSVVNGLFQIWNRHVFLIGALFSAIFQIVFTMNLSFSWTIAVTAALGFLRSFIQITFSLVFAEKYASRFKTAFSLNMVVCGFTTILIGGLAGFIDYVTGDYDMVVYLLAASHLLCAIPWLVELLTFRQS